MFLSVDNQHLGLFNQLILSKNSAQSKTALFCGI